MDLLASCKDKLAYFRIRELKDILTQICLSKQGKKQDLIDRILKTFSDEEDSRLRIKKHAIRKEEVAKLINDTYSKLQASGATDLASKGQSLSDSSNVKVKGELEHQVQLDTKVRCLCGNFMESGPMIKCEDQRCNMMQHMRCVLIPDKPMEGDLPVPDLFYCEICRLNRADPFWLSVGHPLFPVKLTAVNIPTDGTNPVQSVERTFQLTRTNKDLLAKQEYDVQAWCMLLNDKVPYRMQWPQYADLQVNGVPMHAINRPGSQLLGANGRDDGPIITPCTKEGINKICLKGCDSRIFCFGVRIVKRRTVTQILNLIPKETDGERFEDALARVRRCVGGGTSTDDADSDSDIEVVADSFVINLRCPMSGSRMKVAGRFKPCAHMGCFDLEVFVELNQRSRKWQCPICLKNYSLEYIVIDPYFNRITSLMKHCEEDVTEIEAKPDGSWRVKAKTERERSDLGDLGMWHSPDGIVCAPVEVIVKPKLDTSKQIKQEGFSVGHTGLKLGIRKNSNGFWEVSKPEDMKFQGKLENNDQKKDIPRSGEDRSVNGNFGIPSYNGFELDPMPLNQDSPFVFADCNPSAQFGNPEIIVLSGSEGEDHMLRPSAGAPFSAPHTLMDPYPEDQPLGNGGSLGLFNTTEDEYGMSPIWSLLPGTQVGHAFQLFASDTGVSDALADLQHSSMNCPPLMSGYTLAAAALESATLFPNSLVGHSNAEINDGLVANPFPCGGDDPSLQIFLPPRPSDASIQSDVGNQADMANGMRSDDWISLSLGGGDRESSAFDGLSLRHQTPSREGTVVADSASLPFRVNDSRSQKSSRTDGLFSFPRQKRSVRPRLNLSINSDSE